MFDIFFRQLTLPIHKTRTNCLELYGGAYQMLLYVAPQSDITVVPGVIHRLIKRSKVSSRRSGTATRKHLFMPCSPQRNIYCPSTRLPL